MNWYKKAQNKIIQMTPSEGNWAEWALGPMYDHWCDKDGAWDRGGEIYSESQLPKIEGSNLILSDIYEINEDLLYRLEEQSFDVSECDANSEQQKAARCRAAFSLSNKIKGI